MGSLEGLEPDGRIAAVEREIENLEMIGREMDEDSGRFGWFIEVQISSWKRRKDEFSIQHTMLTWQNGIVPPPLVLARS